MQNNKAIYLSIRDKLVKLVLNIVPPKDVEDIVQETYVRVCQAELNTQIHHPRSFLYMTARNLAIDYVKRSENRLVTSLDDKANEGWDIENAELDDTYERVAATREFSDFCEAVRELPQQCRKVFVLKKVYGYTQKEIAGNLGISESTVEKHIANGIKRCRQHMKLLEENFPETRVSTEKGRVR